MQRKDIDLTKFMTYEQAAQWARKNGIKTFRQWWATPRPSKVPADPRKYPEFQSWGEFLGTGRRKRKAPYLPIEQAAEYARTLRLKNNLEWKSYVKTNPLALPMGIPKDPQAVYADQFKTMGGWPWFLGNQYLTYEEARDYIRKLRSDGMAFSNSWEFREWARSASRPDYFPSYPDRMYADEWEGYPVFLGYAPSSNHIVNQIVQELDALMPVYLAMSHAADKSPHALAQLVLHNQAAPESLKASFEELARRVDRGSRPAEIAFEELISLL